MKLVNNFTVNLMKSLVCIIATILLGVIPCGNCYASDLILSEIAKPHSTDYDLNFVNNLVISVQNLMRNLSGLYIQNNTEQLRNLSKEQFEGIIHGFCGFGLLRLDKIQDKIVRFYPNDTPLTISPHQRYMLIRSISEVFEKQIQSIDPDIPVLFNQSAQEIHRAINSYRHADTKLDNFAPTTLQEFHGFIEEIVSVYQQHPALYYKQHEEEITSIGIFYRSFESSVIRESFKRTLIYISTSPYSAQYHRD